DMCVVAGWINPGFFTGFAKKVRYPIAGTFLNSAFTL
ncbi:unnamed protein product, partial [marine sediment metagenome]